MTKNTPLHYQTVQQLRDSLINKKISSVELLHESIKRIEKLDEKINALVVRDFDRALAQAKQADKDIANGIQKPLLGLPISIKESFRLPGLTTTWGNPQFKNWQPKDETLAVSRLKQAGAIIIGKTNVPLMLKDWQSYNDIYGTTNNPWDLNLTPGGSSGGSAAALAAGYIPLELGSDLGGSLRIPAHFCGIYSHKPSVSIVPMLGVAPPSVTSFSGPSDLSVIGPMARTAADLKTGLDIIAGPDPTFDASAYRLALPPARHQQLNQYRVLIIEEHPLTQTESAITKAIQQFGQRLKQAGVNVIENDKRLPCLAETAQTYMQILGAYISQGITAENITAMVNQLNTQDADNALSSYFMRGLMLSHREWLLLSNKRKQLIQTWRAIFKTIDVIICPAASTTAFKHDHSNFIERTISINGSTLPYGQQFCWASIATLLGFPATIAPIAQSEAGLPIGAQIIGDYLEDYTTITFAECVEREFGGFIKPNGE